MAMDKMTNQKPLDVSVVDKGDRGLRPRNENPNVLLETLIYKGVDL